MKYINIGGAIRRHTRMHNYLESLKMADEFGYKHYRLEVDFIYSEIYGMEDTLPAEDYLLVSKKFKTAIRLIKYFFDKYKEVSIVDVSGGWVNIKVCGQKFTIYCSGHIYIKDLDGKDITIKRPRGRWRKFL